jgi:DNA-binding transcriptional MocR family regulator
VGWTAPGRFKTQVEYLKYVSTSATATLPKMAIASFLATGGYDHHLRKLRRFYAEQVRRMSEAVSRYFPAGTTVTRPVGGQVVWVGLPEPFDSLDLYRRALKEKISIAPGPIFSAKKKYRNFIRLNCGNPWSPRIESAMAKLGALISEN